MTLIGDSDWSIQSFGITRQRRRKGNQKIGSQKRKKVCYDSFIAAKSVPYFFQIQTYIPLRRFLLT